MGMLEHALKYDAQGWVLHPLSNRHSTKPSPGKKPVLNGWQNRKSNNISELTTWFEGDNANIGLVCGSASGILIIDIDNDLFKSDLFDGIEVQTLKSARTKGRGHIFFKYTDAIKAQKHHDLGFEILGNGSNAVLPPSVHISGDEYHWVNPGTPIAEIPAELINRIEALVDRKKRVSGLVSKCRKCFKNLWNNKPDMHGAEGREMMLALCTELAANGANVDDIKFVSKILYQKDYDPIRTETEFRNINPDKTWKCNTLNEKLPQYIDTQCDTCGSAKTTKVARVVQSVKMPDVLDVAESIHENSPYLFDRAQCFWLWMDNHYTRVDEYDIVNAVIEQTGNTSYLKRSMKGEMLDAVRITGRKFVVMSLPGHWIQFMNTVVDVKTGDEFKAECTNFYTSPIPHNISQSTDTPNIDQLFTDWVGEDNKQILYEICAYCMLPSYPLHRMFWFKGVGRNGKGRFMALVRRIIGQDNVASTDLERIAESRFESAKLYKRLVAFVGETDHNILRRTNLLKSLTGEDIISGEYKRGGLFDFHNTAKILIATNSVPSIEDKTDGWYARNIIIDFPNKFGEGNDVVGAIEEWEIENMCRKCVDILHDLLERGTFTNEGTTENKRDNYEEASNPLSMYLNNFCEDDVNNHLPLFDFRDGFRAFLSERGYRNMSDKEITMKLKNEGYITKMVRFGEKSWRCVVGLSVKSNNKCNKCNTLIDSSNGSVSDVSLVSVVPTSKNYIGEISESSVTSETSVTQQNLMADLYHFHRLGYSMAPRVNVGTHSPFTVEFRKKYPKYAPDDIAQGITQMNMRGWK